MKGVLRKNNKTKETQPDWWGDATLFGDKWKLAVWIKNTKDGRPYMSMKGELADDKDQIWHASVFKNERKSAECSWDYSGKIRGREDIEIFGTNVRVDGVMTCELRFSGDLPLLQKDRDVSEEEEEIPF